MRLRWADFTADAVLAEKSPCRKYPSKVLPKRGSARRDLGVIQGLCKQVFESFSAKVLHFPNNLIEAHSIENWTDRWYRLR